MSLYIMIFNKLIWFLEIYFIFFILMLVLDFFIASESDEFNDYKLSTIIKNRGIILKNTIMILDFWGIILFLISFLLMLFFFLLSRFSILFVSPFVFLKYVIKISKKNGIILDKIKLEIYPTNRGWIKFFIYEKTLYDINLLVYKILKKIYIGGERLSIWVLMCEKVKVLVLGVPFNIISNSFYLSLILYDSFSHDEGPNIITENIPFNMNKFIICTILTNVDNSVHRIYFEGDRINFNPKTPRLGRYSKSLENRSTLEYYEKIENGSVNIKKINHATLGKRSSSPICTTKESKHGIETVRIADDSFLTSNTFTNPNTFTPITPKNAQIIHNSGLNNEANRLSLFRVIDVRRMFCPMGAYVQNFGNDRLEKNENNYFKNLKNLKELEKIPEKEAESAIKNYKIVEQLENSCGGIEETREFLNKNPSVISMIASTSETNFNTDHKSGVEDMILLSKSVEEYKKSGDSSVFQKVNIPNSCGELENYSPTKGGWGGMP